jgi:hypothetical protein
MAVARFAEKARQLVADRLAATVGKNPSCLVKHARHCWLLSAENNPSLRFFGARLDRMAAMSEPVGQRKHGPEQVSAKVGVTEGEVSGESVGKTAASGFVILGEGATVLLRGRGSHAALKARSDRWGESSQTEAAGVYRGSVER